MSDKTSLLEQLKREATAASSSGAVRTGRTASPDDTANDDVHPSKAYGGMWSRRDRAHTLEFRPCDATGVAEALEYSYLARVQWNAAAGIITLHYQPLGVTVTIQGIGLFDLKEKLRQHHATWIQEQGNDPIKMQAARQTLGTTFIWVQSIRLLEDGPEV